MNRPNPSAQPRFSFLPLLVLLIGLLPAVLPSLAQAQKKSRKKVTAASPQIVLTKADGTSRYRIVVPAAATPHEQKAAQVLQDYLLQVSGAALPIITADKGTSPYEIVLGQNERLAELGLGLNLNDLQEDGFALKTNGSRLIIAGGNEKGTLYGVYTFLENYLGLRMYSPQVKIVPEQKRIVLGKIDDVQVPAIKFRTTHYRVTWDPEYLDWHKLDHDEQGERPDWGLWVHTYHTLVPPAVHYQEHPEYYALVKGKRIPTQLCLTNPEVLEITVQNLRRRMAQNPTATYWSVSQNDNKDYCTCDNCKALDEREGSPSGTILNFANQVAEQFPDKIISTLAYEYGRQAPKTLRPRDNVNIMLCSIEVLRHLPITEDPTGAAFARDVEDWGKIAKDIIIWDYVIQFNHLLSPFPNLHVLGPNMQFFAKNGVTAMFEQGNREVGGEFAELRAYLISKLLWNPDADVEALTDDFLGGYYGPAAPPIRRYLNEMREALLQSGKPLRIFGTPYEATDSYLSPALMRRYESLFDEAEAAVATQPELLERVRIARLPLHYAVMEQAKKNFTGERGVFQKVNGDWEVRPDIRNRIDPFTDLCIRQGVTQVKEWSTSPEEYRAAMYRLFAQGMNEHLAYGKKVTFLSPEPNKLSEEASRMLTDGVRGSHDYAFNWLNFAGQNLEAIIDLEEVKEVRRVGSAYHQFAFWLGILPQKVEYFLSVDGKQFERVASLANTLPIDQYGGQQRDFIVDFAPRPARYVKVIAHSIGNTPGWHPGAGRPAVMRVDEVVVE
jgi:hypothetical protein